MSIATSVREMADWSTSAFFSPVLMIVVFSSEFASSSVGASLSRITLQSPKSTVSMSFYCYSASGSSSGFPSEMMTSFCFFKVSLMLDVRTLMLPSNFWISASINGYKPCPAGTNGMGSSSSRGGRHSSCSASKGSSVGALTWSWRSLRKGLAFRLRRSK